MKSEHIFSRLTLNTLAALVSCSLLSLLLSCGRPDTVNTMETINTSPEGIELPMPSQLDSNSFGTYRGVLPCDNCGVKQVILELREDDTFILKEVHLDDPDKVCTHTGEFKYDDEERTIRLPMEGNDPRFELGDGNLILLNNEGERLITELTETPYLFKSDPEIQLAVWQIVEIGEAQISEEKTKQTHIRFRADNSISYSMGCNQCLGQYKSLAKGEIFFKVGACTKKLCQGDDLEMKLSQALKESQKYELNGRDLTFKTAKGEVKIKLRSLL